MLRHLGQDVTCFASGEEFLAALTEPVTFDLVLLDGAMPGTSSRTTYTQIRDVDASVPVIISSGRSLDLKTFGGDNQLPPDGLLPKPFSLARLTSILQDVCGRTD